MARTRKKQSLSPPPSENKNSGKEQLRQELSNPKLLKKHLKKLDILLKTVPELQAIRFAPDTLSAKLDEIAETYGDELHDLPNAVIQRERILQLALPALLSRRFLSDVEHRLMNYLEQSHRKSGVLKAVSAGLFFLELHRRSPDTMAQNPFWDIIFDLSYHAMIRDPEGILRESTESVNELADLPGPDSLGDLMVSDDQVDMMAHAIAQIKSGDVELGFSLDTILQGLRAYRKSPENASLEMVINQLRTTYPREIGEPERDDLLWGLSYAAERMKGRRKAGFEAVYEAVALLPARENPVMFVLYFKCVVEFYRYLKQEEMDIAKTILEAPDDLDPLLVYGRFLLEAESPKRALKVFQAAEVISPDSPLPPLGIGAALWLTESYGEAVLNFEKAARRWAFDPEKRSWCEAFARMDKHREFPDDLWALIRDTIP